MPLLTAGEGTAGRANLKGFELERVFGGGESPDLPGSGIVDFCGLTSTIYCTSRSNPWRAGRSSARMHIYTLDMGTVCMSSPVERGGGVCDYRK